MTSSREFYRSGFGDRFLEVRFYSSEISRFLQAEETLLNSLSNAFDLLVEVGCMHGRYLNWAVMQSKNYIGVDIVTKYIREGSRRVAERGLCNKSYKFMLGAAEDIATLIHPSNLHVTANRCLLLFPFNSFGNIPEAACVVANLSACRLPFLISSYLPSERATQSRNDYYERCGYANVRIQKRDEGIFISGSEGLHSFAFYPRYVRALFTENGIAFTAVPLARIGVAYGTDYILAHASSLNAASLCCADLPPAAQNPSLTSAKPAEPSLVGLGAGDYRGA